MNQPKFKPGQQWLSRDGKCTFHILSKNAWGQMNCVCISGNAIPAKIWFEETGTYYKYSEDGYDLVTLVKDVE